MVASSDPRPVPTIRDDRITGAAATNVLSGYLGNDRLYGRGGNDLFQEALFTWHSSAGSFRAGTSQDMGLGNDTHDGGAGFDLLSVALTTRAAVLDLTA